MRPHHRTELKKLLTGVVIGGLILAAGLVLFGAKMAHEKGDQIWIEIAKAGVQLGILSIIGGGIAAVLRRLESLREEQRTLNEYRLNVLRDVTTSYNQIKAVRRILRAFGFNSRMTRPLAPDQVTEFHTQMKSLNEAQLALERLKREVVVRSHAFSEYQKLQEALTTVEGYIGDVLKNWEEHGLDIVVGAAPSVLISMERLQGFLDSPEAGFRKGAAEPMDLLQDRIHSQTVGKV
jgi:uncharacterized protein (UPF0335 family)